MTQYYTDFSEYADTSALDAEWTKRFHTTVFSSELVVDAGVTGGKYLRIDQASQDRAGITWDSIDADTSRDELDFLLRIRTSGNQSGQIGALGRGSGTTTSETLYTGQLNTTNVTWRFVRYNNAAASILASGSTSSTNTWYWARIQMRGSALKLRAWTGAVGDEPATWDIETTDSTITAAGWVGLFFFNNGVHDCDVFAVGTGTDPAPTGPVGGTIPVLSAPGVTDIGATSVRPQVTLTY